MAFEITDSTWGSGGSGVVNSENLIPVDILDKDSIFSFRESDGALMMEWIPVLAMSKYPKL